MSIGDRLCFLAERFGSGDGEREASMTRQIAFEPLPASVFALVLEVVVIMVWTLGGGNM